MVPGTLADQLSAPVCEQTVIKILREDRVPQTQDGSYRRFRVSLEERGRVGAQRGRART